MTDAPLDDRDGWIWMDGIKTPWRESRLHVLSHGLHYASSVFEGLRIYNGRIFMLSEHTARLRTSAQLMDFDLPFTDAEIDQACRDACLWNDISDGYIRPVAWRGSANLGIAYHDPAAVHVAIAAWKWGTYFDRSAKMAGIRLMVSPWRRPAPDTAPVHAKTAGLYAICTLSKHAAEARGFTDALMLDYRGLLAEATGANLFLVIDGKVHTPLPDCFLDGITRQAVIKMLKARGIEVVERHIPADDLARAAEVFLTGTAAEVTPVGAVDDVSFNPGALTEMIIDGFSEMVRE